MAVLNELQDFMDISLNEKTDKWAQKVKPKRGKMHNLLNIPEDKTISSKYKSGEALAKALILALNGNKAKASHMLAFAANADKTENVLDSALHYIKKLSEKEKEKDKE